MFGEKFKFYTNADMTKCSLSSFPRFYQEVYTRWSIFPFLLAYFQNLLLSFYGSINK